MASPLLCRNGTFYFRVRARVPTHLVETYGKAHVTVSLHTREPAEDRARARERRVELERALQAQEQGGPKPDADFRGKVLHLSDADIDAVCARYRAAELATDEIDRIKGMRAALVELVELDIETYETALPDLRRAYATGCGCYAGP